MRFTQPVATFDASVL